MFVLNPHSGVALHKQLYEQIKRLVASAQLPPGTELPSIRELALQHAINPMTVSKVYARLESEGVLERHRGKPMTVARQRRPQLSVAARLETLGPSLEALVLAARQLELGANDVIQALRRKWEAGDAATVRASTRAK